MIKETPLCAACGWATGGASNNFRDSCCGIERCSRKGVLQFAPRLRGGERQWTDARVCNRALRRTVYAATDRNEMS
jgi:hypothetical protein